MIITLCGSSRFKDVFELMNQELTLQGHIVLAPGVFHHMMTSPITAEQKQELDNLHRMKIDMSDAIYVINPQQYIGESTYGEIDWAMKHNKKVFFYENMQAAEPEQPATTENPTTEASKAEEDINDGQ